MFELWSLGFTLHTPMPLLEIKNLKLDFLSGDIPLRAVDDVSLTLNAGETVCLVGESGCGKSVTALSIARLVPAPPARYAGGEILLNGRDVLKMSKTELCGLRGGVVSYVFQEPSASLNPVFRVGSQIKEALKLHRPAKATNDEVIRLLKLVGIPAPESRLKDYPFQMSGGMQQRVMIAMALASEPKLLVADEEFRLRGQGHGNHHALLHAAGHLEGIIFEARFGGGNAYEFQQADDFIVGRFGRAMELEGFFDLAADPEDRIERSARLLENVADHAAAKSAQLGLGHLQHVAAAWS